MQRRAWPGGRRSTRTKDIVLAAMAILLVSAAYTSLLIVQRQSALGAMSRYNLTWLVSQAGLEVSRLDGAIAASLASDDGIDQDEIDLRLAIVENRILVLEDGEVAAFIATSPDLASIVDRFRSVIQAARVQLEAPLDREGSQRLLNLIGPLNLPIARLAAAANAYSSDMEAQDRHELNTLHWLFAALLAAITTCGLGLVVAMSWHNRLLARTQAKAVRQNIVLQQRDTELQRRNGQFDAALNNMSQALCMMDAGGRLIVCNTRFAELFGLGIDQLTPGRAVADIFGAGRGPDPGANPHHAMMAGQVVARQIRHASERVPACFVEQDAAGFALAVSQKPMESGGWVSTFEDITERRRTEQQVNYMAHHDALTGLSNRVWFQEKLSEAIGRSRLDGENIAVLCLDLDRFKQVNDMFGHPTGDRLLTLVGARLQGCIRRTDVLARLGGDEFAILQEGAGQPEAAEATAARVVRELVQPYEIDGQRIVIGASVGAALASHANAVPGDDVAGAAASLFNSADIALYRAKAEGKGLFRFYEAAMGQEVRERRQMEADLREALGREEFEVHYQPLYDLASEQVCGFEALIRWMHPGAGMIPPGTFIPIAEESGLIIPIGEWVLAQACTDAARWPDHVKVAVNLSPVQVRQPDLVDMVGRTLARSGLPPGRLEIEITESTLLQDNAAVLETLGHLRALGLSLVLDDFGTGYSSLSYLHSFPFTKVKIDRSFVAGIITRPDCEAIVRAVTVLAASLGMTTTAEGVETAEQLDCLRALSCTEVQGYLFDRPRPVAEIARWFSDNVVPLRRAPRFAVVA